MSTKFIFVTGGVVSGLGKGIAAASIGALLEARGLTIVPLDLSELQKAEGAVTCCSLLFAAP